MPFSPLGVWPVSAEPRPHSRAARSMSTTSDSPVGAAADGALALSASTSPPTLRIQARSPSFFATRSALPFTAA